MGKKTKKGAPRPKLHRQAEPNKFERSTNKKRFEVLGRKVKGDVRHIGRLRTAAAEKRKDTLLVEYKQLRKNNAFIDHRFGEDDETMTSDERALLRFQKQRIREMSGSKFSLPDEDGTGAQEEPLTHLGKSLAELTDFGRGWSSDDDDAALDDQVTRDLHFGGGFVKSQLTSGDHRDGERGEKNGSVPKSKKEVMEEIIAKSKMHKALKARQREEDDKEIDDLDAQWKALASAPGMLGMLRPKGAAKAEAINSEADVADRRFDVLTKELVFEAKAQPGERTLTADELADLERQRLEELEKQRIKRQRGGDDDEDDFEGVEDAPGEFGVSLPAGGYAARRAKRMRNDKDERTKNRAGSSGDGLDDYFDIDEAGTSSSSDDDEDSSDQEEEEGEGEGQGLTALERRRRTQASGSHPLQSAFKEVAAKLLAKHGGMAGITKNTKTDKGKESCESEDEGSDGSSSDASGEGEQETSIEEDEEEEELRETEDTTAPATLRKKVDAGDDDGAARATLTFTPALPESYDDFAVMTVGLSASDLGELLHRMRAFNAAALATEGRKRMQILFGCIMQHFAVLAGAEPPQLHHAEALVHHILELTPQVPFYAASLARARLQRAHQQLHQRLKDPVLKAQAWPSARTLLLLRLFSVVYPVSDKRHPVLTPASLLASSALTLCPITRGGDLATALYLASFVMELHAEAKRFAPEPLTLAVRMLRSVVGTSVHDGEETRNAWLQLTAADVQKLRSDRSFAFTTANTPSNVSIDNLSVGKMLRSSPDDEYFSSPEFKVCASATAARLVAKAAEVLRDVDALPEIMAPAQEALHEIVLSSTRVEATNGMSIKSGSGKYDTDGAVAPELVELAATVAAQVDAAVEAVRTKRRPLCSLALAAKPAVKQYNPRYEDSYVSGKDYDPDRERAERKKLQRELRREERGAIRELRKDAAFMSGVRDKEKTAAQADLDASARRAMDFLQKQESDFKSGGQGGMWKRKNKK